MAQTPTRGQDYKEKHNSTENKSQTHRAGKVWLQQTYGATDWECILNPWQCQNVWPATESVCWYNASLLSKRMSLEKADKGTLLIAWSLQEAEKEQLAETAKAYPLRSQRKCSRYGLHMITIFKSNETYHDNADANTSDWPWQ